MALKSDLQQRQCVVWETKRPFLYTNQTLKSPFFSLINSDWFLNISCLKNKISVEMYFKICLLNQKRVKNFRPFRVTTYLEDPECDGPIFPQKVRFSSTNQAVWYLKYSDLVRQIPSFDSNGVFTIVCTFDTSVEAGAQMISTTGAQTEDRNSLGLFLSYITSSFFQLIIPYDAIHMIVPVFKRIRLGYSNVSDKISSLTQRLPPAFVDYPLNMESLSQDLGGLLYNRILPDTNLRVGLHTIPVHKAVLAARSEVFHAMFQHKMTESSSGVVDIKDVDLPVLETLLMYLYSGKVNEDISEDMVFKLYSASDRYAVCSLTEMCAEFIKENLSEENFVRALVLADAHSDRELKEAVVSLITEHDVLLTSESWITFSTEHPKLALEIYHMWFNKSVSRRKD